MSDDKLIARLPEVLRELAELCGVENALKIAKKFGGTRPYIPKLDDILREVRDARIREEYASGKYTIERMATRHGLCIRQISYILGEEPREAPPTLPLSF
ncbi:MAG: hypothetical protein M0Z48_00505 [Nitrospiraceae bacterium]|nr:hypothetical protein [Nitrospiraceae bacterium]